MKRRMILIVAIVLSVQLGMNAQNKVEKTSPDVEHPEYADSINLAKKGDLELLIKDISLSIRNFRLGDGGVSTGRWNRNPIIILDNGGEPQAILLESIKDIDPESVDEIQIQYGRSAFLYGTAGQGNGVIKIKLREKKEEN